MAQREGGLARLRARLNVTHRWLTFASDVSAAWRIPNVRKGLLGTTLLSLGSLTPAYLPQNSPWWTPLRALGLDSGPGVVVGTLMVIMGAALLVDAWFRLRPSVYHEVKHWAVLLLWSLPLLAAPPIFSHDAYSYAAQGWLMYNGLNPYEVGPGTLPGAFADQVAWVWRQTPSPYGPLSLEISNGLVRLAGLNPYYTAVLERIPALIGVGLLAALIPRLAVRHGRDPQAAAWFATINPLLIIDFVGGMHNDALMMGGVVLALWLADRNRFLWACVVVGLAAAIKQPAFLAAYPVALLNHPWDGWGWRSTRKMLLRFGFASAVSIGTFAAVSIATGLNFGWLNAVAVPGMVISLAPFTLLGWGIQSLLNVWNLDPSGHLALDWCRYIGLGLAALVVLRLAVTRGRREPLTFLSWSYLAVALGSPALHSWYLQWGGQLLPLSDASERWTRTAVIVTAVLLGYSVGNFAWRNDAIALAFAALGLIIAVMWWHVQRAADPKGVDA
ncbi:MAG: polyprenol phosphomannose-dependent alpha 1,6 mannosyltransferase MptB [Propionibacteriaceae bacterium]|nr:polyprenol phosphomannose-dependent alpha 1,6 mannosyltransferase MptB [Micropruina sp.]